NHANGTTGGGLLLNSAAVGSYVINCRFLGNSAAQDGGGLAAANSNNVLVGNCLFSGNTASRGGGLWYLPGDVLTVANCTFSKNHSTNQGGGLGTAGNSTINNCVFWGNDVNGSTAQASQIILIAGTLAVNYDCIQGLTGSFGGTGNIGTDPTFI